MVWNFSTIIRVRSKYIRVNKSTFEQQTTIVEYCLTKS